MRNLLLTLFVLSGAQSSIVQASQHPDYVAGHGAWSSQHWAEASTALSRYWNSVPFGRTYDVAYWLGTSWCRQGGREQPGADLLDWSYHFQSMPEAARAQFRKERDQCIRWLQGATTPRAAPAIVLTAAWTSATARASGKTFYLGNQDKGGLTAYPVRIKRKVGEAEFAARLIETGRREQMQQALQTQAPGFRTYIGKRFAIASAAHSDAQLQRIDEQLDRFAEFVQHAYALPAPRHYVTIYLFPGIPQLRIEADRLHGLDASSMTLGYSLQDDLSVLAMVPSTQVGTILHELFHLLLRGAYGDAPQWLEEGMASLYETSSVRDGHYLGEPNWRSRVFTEFSHAFPQLGLREVITSPWFSDEPILAARHGDVLIDPNEQAFLLAYSRMFVLCLQEQGKLAAVLEAFRERQPPSHFKAAPEQAQLLLEKALGRPLQEIQRAFLAWAPEAANPDTRFHAAPSNAPRDAQPNMIDR